jgi:hypothetical protein
VTPIYVALAALIVATVVWCVWVIRRSLPLEGRFDPPRPPQPSGEAAGMAAGAPRQVARDYRISYQQRIHINIPFELLVRFAMPGKLGGVEPGVEYRDGDIVIITDDPAPTVKVELLFDAGSFEADRKSAVATLAAESGPILRFWLKPLKSEYCLLTVLISHVSEAPTGESVEQIQVTTADDGHGVTQTSTTTVKKPAGARTAEKELDRVTLKIAVTSILGLNARGLDLLLKSLGALIGLFLVALAFITGRQVDWIQGVELVILAIATPLGVTIADPAQGLLKPAEAKGDEQ